MVRPSNSGVDCSVGVHATGPLIDFRSAFGAKRKWTGRQNRRDRSKMTQRRHGGCIAAFGKSANWDGSNPPRRYRP
jgi:hypothetical protein